MNVAVAEQRIRSSLPAFPVESVNVEGEGDFCLACTVNGKWIFRLAQNLEGSRSLEREAALLPSLTSALPLPIPSIQHFGYHSGRLAFVAYPKILGAALTKEHLSTLHADEQDCCARELAHFLAALHSFSVEKSRQAGVVECDYPFCRTESGIMEGTAPDLLNSHLEQLLAYPHLDVRARVFCTRLVEQMLHDQPSEPRVLVHGDLSQDHVLFDGASERITGIIDFTDVIITTPLLDLMYLYSSYGNHFLEMLLAYYAQERKTQPSPLALRTRLLYAWYTALRLLWALDHEYERGIRTRLQELNGLAAAEPSGNEK